jgi:hypothetical protein
MSAQAHRLETTIRERCYDVTAGTERARDAEQVCKAELDAARRFIPRQDVLRLELLIERLCRDQR